MRAIRKLVVSLVVLLLLVGSTNHTLAAPSESELFIQANGAKINQEYKKAAALLKQLLDYYPDTANEEVYWELKELYETKLADFGGATTIYQKYLKHYPEGRFAKDFRDRLAYLLKNQKDWKVIKEYNYILETFYSRSLPTNLQMMERLAAQNPRSSILPDIYGWLALNYYNSRQYKSAEIYIKKYLGTFPGNGKTAQNAINGYKLYSQTLSGMHRFGEAITVLHQAFKYQIPQVEYQKALITIIGDRVEWDVFLAALVFLGLIIGFLIYLKFWRETASAARLKATAILAVIVIIVTLLPMYILPRMGYNLTISFPYLTIAATISLLLTRFLGLVSYKFNRVVYYLLSILIVLDVLYIALYINDAIYIFYTAPPPL